MAWQKDYGTMTHRHSTTWKTFELRVARWFGGTRRGADFQRLGLGQNDVIKEGWSIECKLLKRPSYGVILDAVKQAEAAKEHEDDIAVAVVKRNGDRDEDSLFVLRRDEFLSNFVSQRESE